MKRRDVLLFAAAGSGYALSRRAWAATPCPPPSISVAGGTAVTTACPSGSASSALSDWTARSTASGVVQAVRFNSATNVSKWTHADGNQSLVVQNPSDGIIGDGCLQINQPAALGNGGQWRIPLNAAWTADGSGFGAGVDYYVQYRCKLGPNRLTPAFGDQNGQSGGFKLSILGGYIFSSPGSSSSDIDCEIVCTNPAWINIPVVYNHSQGQIVQRFQRTIAGYTSQQDAVDHGASITDVFKRYCVYENMSSATSPGCWFFAEQQWFTVYLHVKIAVFDASPGTGNVLQMYVAKQGETTYTQLFQENDFQQTSDSGAPGGNQALWLLPYDSHRSSASYSTYQAYDQVIVSTKPIACPQV